MSVLRRSNFSPAIYFGTHYNEISLVKSPITSSLTANWRSFPSHFSFLKPFPYLASRTPHSLDFPFSAFYLSGAPFQFLFLVPPHLITQAVKTWHAARLRPRTSFYLPPLPGWSNRTHSFPCHVYAEDSQTYTYKLNLSPESRPYIHHLFDNPQLNI